MSRIRIFGVPAIITLVASLPYTPIKAQVGAVDKQNPTVQETCISDYGKQTHAKSSSLGIAEPEAKRLVNQIISDLGSTNQPTIVPCGYMDGAQAMVEEEDKDWRDQGVHVPAGEYILYNPTWTRQIIGTDPAQATILFGHEVGHLMNRDFTAARKDVPVITRETDADRFSGCAAARRGIKLKTVDDLLGRLRDDKASDHPSRGDSLKAAQAGYKSCLVIAKANVSQSPMGTAIGEGYIYYEELDGSPTEAGVFGPLASQKSPHYADVKIGDVLRAVKTARLRAAPQGLSQIAGKVEAGECVKISHAPAAPYPVKTATSGGHLLVQVLSQCPISNDKASKLGN